MGVNVADKAVKKSVSSDGKSQALKLAVDQIEKQFGAGSIMRLGETHKVGVETIPTGSVSLDLGQSTYLWMASRRRMTPSVG